MMTVTNPSNSFVMECQASGACAQSQYTFSYTGGMTTFLESIKAGAPYALYGSTFTIDNTARGTNLVVRTIECGHGLCAGATFRFLNADYGDIKCDEYAGCGAGCMVEMPPESSLTSSTGSVPRSMTLTMAKAITVTGHGLTPVVRLVSSTGCIMSPMTGIHRTAWRTWSTKMCLVLEPGTGMTGAATMLQVLFVRSHAQVNLHLLPQPQQQPPQCKI